MDTTKLNLNKKTGELSAEDLLGSPILLEWETIDQQSPRLNEKIGALSDILAQIYTQQELLFAKKHPDTAANEYFLKPLAHFFQNDNKNIDWNIVEQEIKNIFTKLFTETDFTKTSTTNDLHIFVVVKDKKTNTALGLIQFLISPEYKEGDIKAAFYGVLPTAYGRGLEKILMSSIFKLVPSTKRIFLHTRLTNEDAIKMYYEWGFTQFDNKMPNWPDFEYLAEKSETLQR